MNKFRLALSTGHGKKRLPDHTIIDDPGAVNDNLTEIYVCRQYRAALLSLLQLDARFEVIPIQLGLALDQRIFLINGWHRERRIDLAVELHMNSFTDPSADYTEIYHYATQVNGETVSSHWGRLYGNKLLTPLTVELRARDGRHDAVSEPFGDEEWERHRWGFVRGCAPPALIIEPAFLSNPDRYDQILNGDFYSRAAIGIYRGLTACLEV